MQRHGAREYQPGDRVRTIGPDGFPVDGTVLALDSDDNVFVAWEPDGERLWLAPHQLLSDNGHRCDEPSDDSEREEAFGGLASRHRIAKRARAQRLADSRGKHVDAPELWEGRPSPLARVDELARDIEDERRERVYAAYPWLRPR
jgi:hypothetical protein